MWAADLQQSLVSPSRAWQALRQDLAHYYFLIRYYIHFSAKAASVATLHHSLPPPSKNLVGTSTPHAWDFPLIVAITIWSLPHSSTHLLAAVELSPT